MSKLTINNKIYDTDKSEQVLSYDLGEDYIVLFRTEDGEWFYWVYNFDDETFAGMSIEGKYVKQILLNRDRRDLVDKYFNIAGA